ncbi:MAG: hypothetical protein RMJ00_07290 [Nitrososphaerota archaeon]|nr:hypothetical protein [Candidatus Bathyarchaeota archaeon]MCX8162697.1 hypothetical protein [Candidatus Bathyarchaeota archaeon]MDW8062482.1 hypothetical protein [Nitrososphaerota archaeon]
MDTWCGGYVRYHYTIARYINAGLEASPEMLSKEQAKRALEAA